ncbi:pre-mRNA-splicing factor RBM22/SLT11 [Geosmithia morbida]|uniref:Pre-mRNA-splicing factor RBM22/SLT11 n=1 Tax=Geosmithia morbida TaxID=1094350 RepID=A0A9P5CYJ4_9HYPO|nr:pre-mRNA-splicing factor RBM22/SLT11 [Geosmithia morbida]KAF4119462.1 pre-mRNA-splicing factor RBM22/SLT11 [Geosmithia morbida]
MPPQIKQDLNRSGWESTDFPSVCENCLPENPYVQMLKEDYGAECKLCTRPFTIFSWSATRAQGRKKRTAICLTCARLKNCCQSCMLDLSFGLPIAIRDAALKMVAPGPQSDVNREYYAQNNEKLIEEGLGTEEYEKTDEKARELLGRLAQSKPYFRKGRAISEAEVEADRRSSAHGNPAVGAGMGGPGPIRTRDTKAANAAGAKTRSKSRQAFPSAAQLPPSPRDWIPPADKNIMSLFVTGVEDDLPEYKIRDFFKVHGKIKSLVCSHMSHCAFVNYETREAAEKAAAACQGRALISGCPLRIRWGQPKAIGTMDKQGRAEMLRDARVGLAKKRQNQQQQRAVEGGLPQDARASNTLAEPAVALPPGAEDTPKYASLSGD